MLIIYAHPNKRGHTGHILECVLKELNKRKIKPEILDLYKINYDPVLRNEELYTMGKNVVSDRNQKLQEIISKHKKFIFIYPTWWNNMPAILKGFIDRVFVGGFAFKYVNNMPRGLLKGKAVVFTTSGANKFIYWLFERYVSLNVLTKFTLRFCGIKSKGYCFGGCNHRLNDVKRNKISKFVKKGIKYVL